MTLVLYGSPVLSQRAREIAGVDNKTRDLIRGMIDIMDEYSGVGLAAPQVGVSKRVIVVRPAPGEKPVALINPLITSRTGAEEEDEGCLSLPGIVLSVKRAQKVRVAGRTIFDQEVTFDAEGLPARAFQHEIDHLDGILIVDRAGKRQTRAIAGRLEAIRRGEVPAQREE